MAKKIRLTPAEGWVELQTTAADWKNADPKLLGTMLSQLHLIRAFEEQVLELAGEGLVHGPAHSSIGQEGGAVGSIVGMRAADAGNGSHRGHHQSLAKAIGYVGFGYLNSTVKALNVNGIVATIENGKSKAFPISRALYMYVNKSTISAEARSFINFILGAEGQKAVQGAGFIPL